MTAPTVETAIRMAIGKEEQARAFYATWADRVRDPGAAALLRDLATEEMTHKQRLERGLPLARAGASAPEPPGEHDPAETLVERDLTSEANTQDVLIVALKREQRAQELYASLAKWVADADLQRLMTALSAEEADHRRRIQDVYDALILTDD